MLGFLCSCSGQTRVLETRQHRSGFTTTLRRIRICKICKKKIETIEQMFKRPNTKLTMIDVRRIRIAYANGMTQVKLAKKYSVSLKTIWNVLQGYNWTNGRT